VVARPRRRRDPPRRRDRQDDGRRGLGRRLPHDVGDLFHTIYRALGVDADETSFVNKGQPLPIAHESCSVIEEALA